MPPPTDSCGLAGDVTGGATGSGALAAVPVGGVWRSRGTDLLGSGRPPPPALGSVAEADWTWADEAFKTAADLSPQEAEVLNNQGYSYMLRGDYARARAKLDQARRLDPNNRFVQNNLALLAASAHTDKAIN